MRNKILICLAILVCNTLSTQAQKITLEDYLSLAAKSIPEIITLEHQRDLELQKLSSKEKENPFYLEFGTQNYPQRFDDNLNGTFGQLSMDLNDRNSKSDEEKYLALRREYVLVKYEVLKNEELLQRSFDYLEGINLRFKYDFVRQRVVAEDQKRGNYFGDSLMLATIESNVQMMLSKEKRIYETQQLNMFDLKLPSVYYKTGLVFLGGDLHSTHAIPSTLEFVDSVKNNSPHLRLAKIESELNRLEVLRSAKQSSKKGSVGLGYMAFTDFNRTATNTYGGGISADLKIPLDWFKPSSKNGKFQKMVKTQSSEAVYYERERLELLARRNILELNAYKRRIENFPFDRSDEELYFEYLDILLAFNKAIIFNKFLTGDKLVN